MNQPEAIIIDEKLYVIVEVMPAIQSALSPQEVIADFRDAIERDDYYIGGNDWEFTGEDITASGGYDRQIKWVLSSEELPTQSARKHFIALHLIL